VLAIDVLGRLIRRAATLGILEELHPHRRVLEMSPYAVDVVLFYRPTSDDTAAVHEIPHLFSKASGLRVNYSKSSAALINCTKAEAAIVTAGLGCPIVEMPLIYLGIPLTIRRPTCAQLQPLVDSPWLITSLQSSPHGKPI
jgi:hypothetical protein